MNRLTKQMVADRDALADRLTKARDAVVDAIVAYNAILMEVGEYRDTIVGLMEDYQSERSERWQEGERGESYQEWIDAWQELETDDLNEPDMDLDDRLKDLSSEVTA